jgi:hypothetical protein
VPILAYETPAKFRREVRRDGRYIVLPYGMCLPDRCIKCGKPTPVQIPVTFDLVWPMKKVTINVGICWDHLRQHQSRFWRPGIVCLLALLLRGLLFKSHLWVGNGSLSLLLDGALLAGLIWIVTRGQPVKCRKSNSTAMWLRGANEAFLQHLPPMHRDDPTDNLKSG